MGLAVTAGAGGGAGGEGAAAGGGAGGGPPVDAACVAGFPFDACAPRCRAAEYVAGNVLGPAVGAEGAAVGPAASSVCLPSCFSTAQYAGASSGEAAK